MGVTGKRASFGPAPAEGQTYYSRLVRRTAALKDGLIRRVVAVLVWLYRHTIVHPMLRRKHVAASSDGRRIPLKIELDSPLLDPRRGHSYVSNDIRTSRYTVWDFVPKQIFFQFSRVGNFYFLCVGIPQTIPGLSTTGSYTTILPLMFFVIATIIKEGYDDWKRKRLDIIENANFATVLGRDGRCAIEQESLVTRLNPFRPRNETKPWPAPDEEYQGVRWVPVRWGDIRVGDVLRLCRDEPVPADMVLLHSDGENGLAYIETMALDGETNLKSKQVCPALQGCDTIAGIAQCGAELVVEDPNPDLYSFNGRVSVRGEAMPLTVNEVLYRGSVLRNTACAVGVVVSTGEETKIRKNANQHPKAKKPALEKVNNKIVVTLAIYVVILSVGVSMGYIEWKGEYERHAWYLKHASVPFHEIIIAFIIMFNNVVPLSLYVTLEIVKIGQLLMMNSDIHMYDDESDTPARCNTNTILENLGQIGYIFSDKTGTLTDNVMKFRKVSVAGTVWLHEMDLEAADEDGGNASSSTLGENSDSSSSIHKPQPLAFVVPEAKTVPVAETPVSPSRPSMGRRSVSASRRSSSHWQSTGRPDHVQPEVNTNDLLEYVRLRPHSSFSRKAREYMLAMALCHTCLPEIRDGKVEYQASSPDELALVKAAKELGYAVLRRSARSITLRLDRDDGQAEEQTFQVLDVIEFSSARKRMSVVVRYPDGRISVICKGADSAILPRLKMSSLAKQKATEARQSADLEHERLRYGERQDLRRSLDSRSSLAIRRHPRISMELRQSDAPRSSSFEASRLLRPSQDLPRSSVGARGPSLDGRRGQGPYLSPAARTPVPVPERFAFLEDRTFISDSDVFARCFQHLEEFASEGLRTLLYAQRFVPEADYQSWKKTYDEATTSLVDREQRIEEAGDLIEQSFDLVGATAIEDKLQKGVPETVDRLRKANIKMWMLTGDKRETAINIAHSARICRPGSDLYILDSTKGALDSQLATLAEDLQVGPMHSVVVVDGATLAAVEGSPELSAQFFDAMVQIDSVICCRASPAQKALLVREVRSRIRSLGGGRKRGLTLSIGDGANDLAMIQASHVGVGISGKEGLQAARVADYSIAQFRFLQRLLLVHGRWNYVRTAKFILCTFWKEMFFYLPTACYQRYNGYTGTSLYEATSLTVFNTLFTSLCTICMGIWEQDLQAETLLAVPELYAYGQRNRGLNLWNYTRWMFHAACQGVLVWYGVWAGYGYFVPSNGDPGLYALGQLTFSVGILWINWKLFIFETHHKTGIVMFSFFLTTIGWWAWSAFLDGVFAASPSGPYAIRGTFTTKYGRNATWWATLFVVLALLGMMDILLKVVRRNVSVLGRAARRWRERSRPSPSQPWWRSAGGEPSGTGKGSNLEDDVDEEGEEKTVDVLNIEIWQELEQDPTIFENLKRMARDGDGEDDDDEHEDGLDVDTEKKSWISVQLARFNGKMRR
ncbi:Magnesium-transporting ATPase (P-type) [Geosmithia morbida]|uniref:Phospholipid-transporting ATPase n=1 Tax=Geosmithia morbida TaxID=1094350 RepID=A0A9P4YWN3_9HYPO|nr:Magnesium-transporting ATPase (P-type) [Geosmithia morbida]KAF4123912.1 Magnesium-transporting ATPase (P-type) [Geosmithia morbida]